jgi:hypothetical protein
MIVIGVPTGGDIGEAVGGGLIGTKIGDCVGVATVGDLGEAVGGGLVGTEIGDVVVGGVVGVVGFGIKLKISKKFRIRRKKSKKRCKMPLFWSSRCLMGF